MKNSVSSGEIVRWDDRLHHVANNNFTPEVIKNVSCKLIRSDQTVRRESRGRAVLDAKIAPTFPIPSLIPNIPA